MPWRSCENYQADLYIVFVYQTCMKWDEIPLRYIAQEIEAIFFFGQSS